MLISSLERVLTHSQINKQKTFYTRQRAKSPIFFCSNKNAE